MGLRRLGVISAIGFAMAVTGFGLAGFTGRAEQPELNIYTSRHYQTDQALYDGFTNLTGIQINRLEGKGDALIERLRNEGTNSPADLLITVDAGRLWRAEQADLFQPVRSQALEAGIPVHLRHPEGLWFGFSTRARLIYFNRSDIRPDEITRYAR
jgi:iron(III) transport system substrate-binding protein